MIVAPSMQTEHCHMLVPVYTIKNTFLLTLQIGKEARVHIRACATHGCVPQIVLCFEFVVARKDNWVFLSSDFFFFLKKPQNKTKTSRHCC